MWNTVGEKRQVTEETHEVCDISDQEAHYHTFGPNLGLSSLT